jgi:ATP-binding cassette subfamily F protein 3
MLLSVSAVHKGYGVEQIFTGVSFMLRAREKVALVGRNGAGKTTLLKVITGQEEPDSGSVHLARGAKIGYLKQEAPVGSGRTVLEEAQSALEGTLELKRRLEALEAKLDGSPTDEDLEEYALLHEHFLENEGYSAERDVRTVLKRMGFEEEEFDKATADLSGGEKTRLAIARLLLEEPDLLILDEPTNHLDLTATEWLEGWIRSYHGAVLLVSHDRVFLQNTAERVLEMRDGKVKSYEGTFEQFLRLRAEEQERQIEVAKQQKREMDKLDEYVRRFMGSERTAQARGRLKMLERMRETAGSAPKSERGMAAALKPVKRAGDLVFDVKDLGVRYDGHPFLFRHLDWTIRWGDRWGVIGENGAGKSTLVKALLGRVPAQEGSVRQGSNVEVGYFSQDTAELPKDKSPLDVMVYEVGLLPAEARTLLGRFLFSGDDVFRPVSTLSGGEKNKLSLACLAALNPNVLVLDEPTNHLDMDSRDALADVLRDFRGTLVVVSHDRWLLQQVSQQTLDIRRDRVVQYPGSYESYRRRQAHPAQAGKPSNSKQEAAAPGLSPREVSKEIGRLAKLVEDLEKQVSAAEREIAAIEQTLSELPPNADILALTTDHSRAKDQLEGLIASWEEASIRLEELRALQG